MDNDLALREQMLEVKQCLGCSHEGVIITAADGQLIDTTPAAELILEMPAHDLKSRNINEFCANPDAYGDLRAQALKEGRSLNRSILISTGSGRKKLLNMSIQRFDT